MKFAWNDLTSFLLSAHIKLKGERADDVWMVKWGMTIDEGNLRDVGSGR